MKQTLLLLLASVAFLLTSCDPSVVYKQFETTSNLEWAKDDVKTFTFDNVDDTTAYDVYFAFRYAHGFRFKESSVLIVEGTPAGKRAELPLKFKTVDDNNDYIGDGSGDIWDLEIPIKENVTFEKGKYTYAIGHTFPKDVVNMVMEVGIIIRKAEGK